MFVLASIITTSQSTLAITVQSSLSFSFNCSIALLSHLANVCFSVVYLPTTSSMFLAKEDDTSLQTSLNACNCFHISTSHSFQTTIGRYDFRFLIEDFCSGVRNFQYLDITISCSKISNAYQTCVFNCCAFSKVIHSFTHFSTSLIYLSKILLKYFDSELTQIFQVLALTILAIDE